MTESEQIFFPSLEEFGLWLKNNHNKSRGIWMVFYKKHTKKPGVAYSDALDEALCYGWIDSIIKRIDDEKYVRRFTPRTNYSNWSDINKLKVLKLMKAGRMTEHGLQKIESYRKTGKIDWVINPPSNKTKKPFKVPAYVYDHLKKDELAYKRFESLISSHKRNYILWIEDAKKEETKIRRIDKMIKNLKENKKLF